MFIVFPVYPHSLCVSHSTHEGALPSPAFPLVKNHRSSEIHPVMFIPGPWVKKTRNVLGDSNILMLDGHNTGMMIPHLSPIMDNLMLPLTMVSSSCAWPFSSFKVKSEGKGWVGFFPAYAPYLFCDSPQPDKADTEQIQRAKQGKVKLPGRDKEIQIGTPAKRPGLGNRMEELSEKTGFKMSIGGRGRVYIPTCKTVMKRMTLTELLYGWAKILIAKAIDGLANAFLKPRMLGNNQLARLDNDVARRWATREFSEMQARVLSRAARRDVMKYVGVEIARKTAYDGMIKSIPLDSKIKMPYGLFSYNFADGKGTFLWWGEFGSGRGIEFKGIRGETLEALQDAVYQPQVEEILADNPNHATAAGGTPK